MRDKKLESVFASAIVFLKCASFVAMTLWQDSLKAPPDETGGVTSSAVTSAWSNLTDSISLIHDIDPFFCVFSQMFLMTAFFGCILLTQLFFYPQLFTDRERKFRQKKMAAICTVQTISTLLVNFTLSGTRIPPYLIASLANFQIPAQFTTRLLILWKMPTLRKGLCAVAVMLAEFICLIPTIFPSLTSQAQRLDDGGAKGSEKIIWCFIYVAGLIPGTIVSAFMEDSLQGDSANLHSQKSALNTALNDTATLETADSKDEYLNSALNDTATLRKADSKDEYLNMSYYMFFFGLWGSVSMATLFWVDILPFFGTAANIGVFGERMKFNLLCLFGGEGCDVRVYMLGWTTLVVNTTAFVVQGYILRYSEGANFMTIVVVLRSPIILLFWTLFHENPFYWHPHPDLGTWLGLSGLVLMIPAIHIYNTGAPERKLGTTRSRTNTDSTQNSDRDALLDSDRDALLDSERDVLLD